MAKKKPIKETNNPVTYNVKKKKGKNLKRRKIIKRVILTLLILMIITAGVVFGILYGIVKDAKLGISDLVIKYENTVVKDIDGNTIAVLSGDENRETVSISDMPEYLPKAFVAIEDERFYNHMGVDIKRTAAATVNYILHGGSSSFGGSTITQQLVKNLTNEKQKSWKRKVTEMSRAYYIEKDLSKDQILELYLNLIYLGGNTYGVQVASNYYFSKSASELDLAECAFLAGINNTPNSYNPFDEEDHDEIAKLIKTRTKTVLAKMKEEGYITSEEEYNAAIKKVDDGLVFTKGEVRQTVYSYHTDAAVEQVIRELMEQNPDWNRKYTEMYVKSSGFTIYTTQKTSVQKVMEEEVAKSKYQVASKKTEGATSQAAMVVIDYKTGYVLGTVGGTGEKTASFGLNRATQSTRQTGSSMKPLAVLAPGIDKGIITAGTVLDDVPTRFGSYPPKNYNYYRGLITVRYAIETSQNIPMVKGMSMIGPENSIEFLKSMGISSMDADKDNSLPLALGGLFNGISPLEMAAGYGVIANDGVYIEPTFYTKVVDTNGDIIIEPKQETRTVMLSASAYVVKEILTQPVKSGTATYCSISGMSVAAKTGTTDDDYDRWLCGFTPYYSAATWFGYDDNETVRYSGGNPSGVIWSSVMKQIHNGLEGKSFASTRPDGVTTASICKCSGMLATEYCANDSRGSQVYTEFFVKGTVPTKHCECHVSVDICNDTGKIANEHCTNKTTKIFITRPDSDTNTSWKSAKDAEYMLTIKDTCDIHTQSKDSTNPVIKLKGDSNITLKLNETYNEQGATASDDRDGDLTSKIQMSGTVNTAKEGTYTITYSVKDSSGNESTAKRTVTVEAVASKPTITLNGNATVNVRLNETYTDAGANATDSKDGKLTNKIVVSGLDRVDTSIEGTYTITYTIKNSSGKEASITRKVIVNGNV